MSPACVTPILKQSPPCAAVRFRYLTWVLACASQKPRNPTRLPGRPTPSHNMKRCWLPAVRAGTLVSVYASTALAEVAMSGCPKKPEKPPSAAVGRQKRRITPSRINYLKKMDDLLRAGLTTISRLMPLPSAKPWPTAATTMLSTISRCSSPPMPRGCAKPSTPPTLSNSFARTASQVSLINPSRISSRAGFAASLPDRVGATLAVALQAYPAPRAIMKFHDQDRQGGVTLSAAKGLSRWADPSLRSG